MHGLQEALVGGIIRRLSENVLSEAAPPCPNISLFKNNVCNFYWMSVIVFERFGLEKVREV